MPEIDPDKHYAQRLLTLLILIGAIFSIINERLSPDITALLAIIALLQTDVLTLIEAFACFSHPATVSVANVLMLKAGIERTITLPC